MTIDKLPKLLIPWCVFLLLMGVSLVGWYYTRQAIDQHTEHRFEIEAAHLQEQIQNRFYTYEQVLKGGVGLFKGASRVTRTDWRAYIESLELAEHFPGIQGVGFSEWIGGNTELDEHERKIQAEGFGGYKVKPPGARDHYTAIIYLEPFDERNRQAFGYDMYSQATRREAMERARDTGKSALSGKVELVQEITVDKQAGFLLYLPLYSSDTRPESLTARRESILGFVYSPFRATDLMHGILQERYATISFQIYDGNRIAEGSMLYDGEKELGFDSAVKRRPFTLTNTIDISGRPWTIRYSTTPYFGAIENSVYPWILLVAGFLLSSLVFAIVWMLLTARQRIETRTAELYKQEALNSALLENLEEGVVACDAELNLTLFNKKAREWHGCDLRYVPAERWSEIFDLFEEDGLTRFTRDRIPLVRAFNGERISDQGMSICLRGKPPRHVLASGNSMFDNEGRRIGAVVLMRDITESRQAAESVRLQQEFLRLVIDNNPNYIFARDREGGYVLANKTFAEDYFDLTPDQLIGRKHAEIVEKQSRGRLVEQTIADDVRVISTGEYVSKEEQFLDLHGNMHWINSAKLPIQAPDSSETIALTVASDITELKVSQERIIKLNEDLESRVSQRTESLKQANQELIAAKEVADSANLAKSSFLASMSHEIRTPMNGVVGMVDILMNESLTRDQKDSVRTIRDSAFSLLRIIDDLLDFSKIEAGHTELESLPLSIADIAENVVGSMIQLALNGGVYLSVFIDPDIPDRLLGDATRLRQIITNLIANAVKFSGRRTDTDGRVSLRITMDQSQPLILRFTIADNGIGMAPETVRSVFKPFVQAETSTTRRFGGTGLGLSICKRLVELMQGEIQVVSEETVGSTFSVLLPFAIAASDDQYSYEDIAGVNCIIIPSEPVQADEFKAYLQAAKAIVCIEKDMQAAARKAPVLEEPVVVLQSHAHVCQQDIDDVFAIDGDVRHVLLAQGLGRRIVNMQQDILKGGRRRRPRLGSVNTVTIDSDGLRRSALIEAVAIAAGRASPEVMQNISEEKAVERVEPLSVKDAEAAGQLILVAEDDLINTKVISRQLSLLGFTAEFAEDGLEALAMWRKSKYGFLLTDLHMPKMDGYELTQRIRQEENEGERVPIVALTANALRGEVNRAKSLGVDEYLTKPIELTMLKEALEHFIKPAERQNLEGNSPSVKLPVDELKEEKAAIFDHSVLPELVGNDRDVICDFLGSYIDSINETNALVADAGENRDWQTVGRLAHRLKSSSLSIGALQLGECCKNLEYACKENQDGLLDDYLSKFMVSLELTRAQITANVGEKKN